MTLSVGTPVFAAPEQLGAFGSSLSQYGTPVDVWALGCVIYYLYTNRSFPYDDVGDNQLLSNIIAGKIAPALPTSSPMHTIVAACCEHAASRRPRSTDVVEFLKV